MLTKDTEDYFKYWEERGYEFVEGRTVDKKGFTKFIWIKRKKNPIKSSEEPSWVEYTTVELEQVQLEPPSF